MLYLQSLQQSEVLEGSSLYNTDLVVLQMTIAADIKRQREGRRERDNSYCHYYCIQIQNLKTTPAGIICDLCAGNDSQEKGEITASVKVSCSEQFLT